MINLKLNSLAITLHRIPAERTFENAMTLNREVSIAALTIVEEIALIKKYLPLVIVLSFARIIELINSPNKYEIIEAINIIGENLNIVLKALSCGHSYEGGTKQRIYAQPTTIKLARIANHITVLEAANP